VQEFDTKLDECLTVNENPNVSKEGDGDISSRSMIVKRQPVVKGKGKGKQAAKGRANVTRNTRKNKEYDDESSDSEIENNPRRKRQQKVVESSSDDEDLKRKPPARKQQPAAGSNRSTRASRTKIIEEFTSSGENVLRENNSFEN
jgi:hypothetical protein